MELNLLRKGMANLEHLCRDDIDKLIEILNDATQDACYPELSGIRSRSDES